MNEEKTNLLKQAEDAFNQNDIQSASKYLAQFGEGMKEENLPLEFLSLARKCVDKDIEFLKEK
jgi:hypothetical protein